MTTIHIVYYIKESFVRSEAKTSIPLYENLKQRKNAHYFTRPMTREIMIIWTKAHEIIT